MGQFLRQFSYNSMLTNKNAEYVGEHTVFYFPLIVELLLLSYYSIRKEKQRLVEDFTFCTICERRK